MKRPVRRSTTLLNLNMNSLRHIASLLNTPQNASHFARGGRALSTMARNSTVAKQQTHRLVRRKLDQALQALRILQHTPNRNLPQRGQHLAAGLPFRAVSRDAAVSDPFSIGWNPYKTMGTSQYSVKVERRPHRNGYTIELWTESRRFPTAKAYAVDSHSGVSLGVRGFMPKAVRDGADAAVLEFAAQAPRNLRYA